MTLGETDYGLFYGGDGRQLSIQLLGALVIAFWSCSFNFALFSYLKTTGKLRVAREEEISGLNASLHGIPNKKQDDEEVMHHISACGDYDARQPPALEDAAPQTPESTDN